MLPLKGGYHLVGKENTANISKLADISKVGKLRTRTFALETAPCTTGASLTSGLFLSYWVIRYALSTRLIGAWQALVAELYGHKTGIPQIVVSIFC